MRSDSKVTVKGAPTNEVCASAVKRIQSGPRTTRRKRSRAAVVTQADGAVHPAILRSPNISDHAAGQTDRSFPERERVSVMENPPLVAAEISAQIGGATAQDR